MTRSIAVIHKKKSRGRPATGHDPLVALRLAKELIATIDAWAEREQVGSRSEAIRRLIELGLLAKTPSEMKNREPGSRVKRAAKAADMAGQKIDQLGDKSAPAEVRAQRKRRLVKGPS